VRPGVAVGQDRAGTISIGGSTVDGPGVYVAPELRRIGYVPQEGSLFPHLTVAGNEDGLTARVTSYRYHGHDAVLCVQPGKGAEAWPIVVRITGGPHRPVGSAVTLRARGPVFAWPAD